MNDKTLLIIAAGGLAVWYLTSRPAVASPAASAPPPLPYNYGAAAGYQPPVNMPTDPGDRNSWAPALAAGLGAIGNIATAAINRSNSSTSSGTYNDPYASSVADGGWSEPDFG